MSDLPTREEFERQMEISIADFEFEVDGMALNFAELVEQWVSKGDLEAEIGKRVTALMNRDMELQKKRMRDKVKAAHDEMFGPDGIGGMIDG